MASIIESIHQHAQDPQHDLVDLLTRGIFAATALRESRFRAWLTCERDGYQPDQAIPLYRKGSDAVLLAWRPGLGWIEAPISEGQRKQVSTYALSAGIPALLEDYAEMLKKGGRRRTLSPEEQAAMAKLTNLDTELCQVIPAAVVTHAVLTARFGILKWSEALLEAGVRGQGSSFTAEERATATAVGGRFDELLAQAEEMASASVVRQGSKQPGFLSRLLGRASA